MPSISGSDNPGPGALPTFGADVNQVTRVARFPVMGGAQLGAAGAEQAQVFGRLSNELGSWGDAVAHDEGVRAGKVAGLDPNYRPDADESLKGIARRNAADAAYGNNLEANFRTDVTGAYNTWEAQPADKRTPATLAASLAGIKADYDKNHVFPELQAPFNAAAATLFDPLMRNAQAEQDARLQDQARASFLTNQISAKDTAMRIARLPASSDADITRAVAQHDASVDALAKQGAITAVQAVGLKRDFAQDVYLQRGKALFDNAPDDKKGPIADAWMQNYVSPASGDPAAARQFLGRLSSHPDRPGDVSSMHPDLAVRLAGAIQEARASGLNVTLTSGWRSRETAGSAYDANGFSLHDKGGAADVGGIGAPGSPEAQKWADIAGKHGLYNPYGVDNPKEWNHWQLVPYVIEKRPDVQAAIAAAGGDQAKVWNAIAPVGGGAAARIIPGLSAETASTLSNYMTSSLRTLHSQAEHTQKLALADIAGDQKAMESGFAVPDSEWATKRQEYAHSVDPAVASAFALTNTIRDLYAGFKGMPPDAVSAVATTMRAQFAAGATPLQQAIVEAVEKYANRLRTDVATDPLSRAVVDGLTPPLRALDPSSPQALKQSIDARTPTVAQVQQRYGVQTPFFARGEGAAFGEALARTGAPLGAAADPATLTAMSEDDGFRKALLGNARSGDPARMHGAFSAMQSIADAAPLAFDKQFGREAATQLDLWKSVQAYRGDEAAKIMMALNDPSQAQRRRQLDEAADASLKTVTPAAVAGMLGQRSLTNPFGSVAAPASTLDNPQSAPGGLLTDYRDAYKARFALDGSADAASQYATDAVSKKWGVSGVNSGRLMAYPPERYYPAVDGGHDWLKAQLDGDVRKQIGDTGGVEPGHAEPIWPKLSDEQRRNLAEASAPRALVADFQTKADVESGKAPSYRVIIQDGQGQFHALEASPGVPFRFYGDPAAPAHAAEDKFTTDMQNRRALSKAIQDTPPEAYP